MTDDFEKSGSGSGKGKSRREKSGSGKGKSKFDRFKKVFGKNRKLFFKLFNSGKKGEQDSNGREYWKLETVIK
jgi:hypothetical protein